MAHEPEYIYFDHDCEVVNQELNHYKQIREELEAKLVETNQIIARLQSELDAMEYEDKLL